MYKRCRGQREPLQSVQRALLSFYLWALHKNSRTPDQDLIWALYVAVFHSLLLLSLLSGNKERKEAIKLKSLSCTPIYTQTHIKARQTQGWFISSLQWVVGECCAASLFSGRVCVCDRWCQCALEEKVWKNSCVCEQFVFVSERRIRKQAGVFGTAV